MGKLQPDSGNGRLSLVFIRLFVWRAWIFLNFDEAFLLPNQNSQALCIYYNSKVQVGYLLPLLPPLRKRDLGFAIYFLVLYSVVYFSRERPFCVRFYVTN
jgi:hypothetical protein